MDSRENKRRKWEEAKWEVGNSRATGRAIIGAIVNNSNFLNKVAIKGRQAKGSSWKFVRSNGFCFVFYNEELQACFYADGNVPVERKN